MTGRKNNFIAAGLIVPGVLLSAGCGAYGTSVVQGSKSDTALEAGIGQEFQKLVPAGTAVRDVRCFRLPTPTKSGECRILMIRSKPDRSYTYLVSTARHRFLAWTTGIKPGDTWIPPGSFSGGY
jgi:hypothetical protein